MLLHIDCVVLGALESRGGAEKQGSHKEVVILERRREPRKKKVENLAKENVWKVGASSY